MCMHTVRTHDSTGPCRGQSKDRRYRSVKEGDGLRAAPTTNRPPRTVVGYPPPPPSGTPSPSPGGQRVPNGHCQSAEVEGHLNRSPAPAVFPLR